MGKTTVKVKEIPKCDICKAEGKDPLPAIADARLPQGSWANVCHSHFIDNNCQLGTGKGQKYVLIKDQPSNQADDRATILKRTRELISNFTDEDLEILMFDSVVPTACPEGCEVEPDGKCCHGYPSPLLTMGMI